MSVFEDYKLGKLSALMTWHGTFLAHVPVGDFLCHQSLDLASGEPPSLLVESSAFEDPIIDGFWLQKVYSRPIAFPKLKLLAKSNGFTSFECVDGHNLYPFGKGHLMTAEENTGKVYMDRDIEKDWERFLPISFDMLHGLSALLKGGRLTNEPGSLGAGFRLHVGANVSYGNVLFPISVNSNEIAKIGTNSASATIDQLSELVSFFIRDNTDKIHRVFL